MPEQQEKSIKTEPYLPTILVVDDDPYVLKSMLRTLDKVDMRIITAASAEDGLQVLTQTEVDVVISDNCMPGMDGITFLERVKVLAPDITRIMLTGQATVKSAQEAINRSKIFEFLTKPWNSADLKGTILRSIDRNRLIKENRRLQLITQDQNVELNRLNRGLELRVRQRTAELAEAVREGIIMLALAAEAKDDDTGEHIQRIQHLTQGICLQLGMNDVEASDIGIASITHDVGKIHIPDGILRKPGRLTEKELEIMRGHTVAGEKILGASPFYKIARQIARSHHERIDGDGYPDGLKGDAIPLPARIVSVADVFDALTNERPYKSAWPRSEALSWMKAQIGTQFDEVVFGAFIKILETESGSTPP